MRLLQLLVLLVFVAFVPNDYYPVERTRMLRFRAGCRRRFGGLVSVH